jgi:hypothetical protein
MVNLKQNKPKKIKTEIWAANVMTTVLWEVYGGNFSFVPSAVRLILRDMPSLIIISVGPYDAS